MKKHILRTLGICVGCVLLIGVIIWRLHLPSKSSSIQTAATSERIIHAVAAENFWGSILAQLGGTRIQVESIVSDPNADPHEYASNTKNARNIADAEYVVVNGAGYDSWAKTLLSAGMEPQRKVLDVAKLLGKKEGSDPHFWYNPDYVNAVVAQMEHDLIAMDPAAAPYFGEQYQALRASLAIYQQRIIAIRDAFPDALVAATEDVFSHLATAAGLDLVSPPAFMQAMGEGIDPPTASVVQFEQELKNGNIRILVYNTQTVTPLTESIKTIAAEQGIPVIGMTETIQPPDATFQDWMNAQVIELQNALSKNSKKP